MPGVFKYEIKFLTRAGVQVALISSTSGRPPIISAEWALARIGGAMNFTMRYPRDALPATVVPGNIVEVWVQPASADTIRLFYTGSVTTTPKAGTTTQVVRIDAVGLWEQLQKTIVVEYYAADDIDEIVKDLLAAYQAGTDVSTSTAQISLSAAFGLGDFEQEFTSFASAIEQLARVQGAVNYGVDVQRRLYFTDVTNAVVQSFWVGKHISEFDLIETRDELINDLFLQAKTVIGGGFLMLHRDDTTSITTYGKRSRVVTVPKLENPDDVWRYAEKILNEESVTHQRATTEVFPFTAWQFPAGKAKITDEDGNTHSLPIQTVRYVLNGDGGLFGSFELGDEPTEVLSDQIGRLARGIEIAKEENVSRTQIVHTEEEEFLQVALVSARSAGKLNFFADALKDTKRLNLPKSQHVNFRDHYLFGPLPYATSEVQTVTIPTGRDVSSVRVHTLVDLGGRINFENASDLDFFFTGPSQAKATVNYRVREDDNRLEAFQGTLVTQMFYFDHEESAASEPPGKTRFELVEAYELKVKIDFVASNQASPSAIQFAYKGVSDYQEIRIQNGTQNLTFKWFDVVGGSATQRGGTGTMTKDNDYVLKITVRHDPAQTEFSVSNAADTSVLFTSTNFAISNPAGSLAGVKGIFNTDAKFYIDYWEMKSGTTNDMGVVRQQVSRDGGTTFSTFTNVLDDTSFTDVTVSGQTSGTDLIARFRIAHPARLLAYALSWDYD